MRKLRRQNRPRLRLMGGYTLFISDDGIRISFALEMPDNNPGKCPLFIVIHGFTSCKERPHTLAACQAMRDAGFATLRADMYGHGESGGEFENHTLFKWISNIMTLVDHARTLDFVTDIWLSGHSQGGLAAALVAGMEPDRIRGLILRAPAFMIPVGARAGELLGVKFDPDHIPDSIPTIKDLTLGGNYIRVAQMIHAEDAVDRFHGPVLILHGEKDDVVPLRDSEDVAGRYRNGSLTVIPGENHSFEFHQDQMQAVIQEWLQKQQ